MSDLAVIGGDLGKAILSWVIQAFAGRLQSVWNGATSLQWFQIYGLRSRSQHAHSDCTGSDATWNIATIEQREKKSHECNGPHSFLGIILNWCMFRYNAVWTFPFKIPSPFIDHSLPAGLPTQVPNRMANIDRGNQGPGCRHHRSTKVEVRNSWAMQVKVKKEKPTCCVTCIVTKFGDGVITLLVHYLQADTLRWAAQMPNCWDIQSCLHSDFRTIVFHMSEKFTNPSNSLSMSVDCK